MKSEWLKTLKNMYIVFMLLLYPLAIRNGYSDIARAKLVFFYVISILFILGSIVIIMFERIYYKKKIETLLSKKDIKWLVMIGICLLLSFIKNGNYRNTLLGYLDYGEGFLFIICIIIVYFLLHLQNENELLFCLSATTGLILVVLVGVFQYLQYDVASMYSRTLNGFSSLTFISTMSNVDCAGYYFAIMFPFSVYLCIRDRWKLIGGIGVISSVVGILISNTDTAIVGLIFELLVLFLVSRKEKVHRLVSYYVLLLVGIGIEIIGFIRNIIDNTRELNEIQMLIASPLSGVIVICIAMVLLLVEYKEKNNVVIDIAIWICLLILCAFPMAVIMFTAIGDANSAGILKNGIYFNNHWGSGRGYIWKCGLHLFKESSIWDKLLGNGVTSFGKIYNENRLIFNEMYEPMYINAYLCDVHNMYLHFIFEYGLLSFIAVVGYFVFRLISYFKDESYFYRIKAVALLGAMIMALITISSNIHMAFIPLLL